MGKVVVLFGPPAIGKSTIINQKKKQYPGAQIVSIDKDVISNFFDPHLSRKRIPNFGAMADVVWRTTGFLTELLLTDYRPRLTKVMPNGDPGLIFFIQGVTEGGIEHDIRMFLDFGFEVEFVLLTTTEVGILEKRIVNRSKKTDFVGAPPMSSEELQSYINDCVGYFYKAWSTVKFRSFSSMDTNLKSFSNSEDARNYKSVNRNAKFYEIPHYDDRIKFEVLLTRPFFDEVIIDELTAEEMESQLITETFLENQLVLNEGRIGLHSRDGSRYVI